MANRSQAVFNVITRQQVYIEGLKEGQQRAALLAFAAMEAEVKAVLAGLPVENVGDLTQAQIRALLRQLKGIQTKFYSAAVTRLIAFLGDWLVYEIRETPYLLSDADNPVVPLPSLSSLWPSISTADMGATGDTLLGLLAALGLSANRDMTRRVKGGIADNMTLAQFTAFIVGTGVLNGRDGIMNKGKHALTSAIATTMQQVISQLRDRAYGLLTDFYMWNSVIDGATTDICRGRNGRTFRRGQGPIPPAHFNCRSSTVPIFLRETIELPTSYYRWLTDQPAPFVRDILPRRLQEVLRRGELRATDLPKFSDPAPLTLDEYKSKTNRIKTGTDG